MCTLPRLIRSCIPGFILPYQNIVLLPSPFLHIVKWALAKTEIKEFKTIKWKLLSPHFTLLAPDLLPFHMPYYSVQKPPFEVGFEEDEGKGAEGKTDPFFPPCVWLLRKTGEEGTWHLTWCISYSCHFKVTLDLERNAASLNHIKALI